MKYKIPYLGDRVKDKVTGFEGIVIGRTEWLYGCTRLGVESESMHEGKPIASQWFDQQRVEILQAGVVAAEDPKDSGPVTKIGGPKNDPVRRTTG